MKLKAVGHKRDIRLTDADAQARGVRLNEEELEAAVAIEVERISEFQRMLWADGRHALLIVLQGRDASGKDGAIRKVFTAVNPQGCTVSSFGVPTEAERKHDFLWRIHHVIPPRGMIGIFNRSHYEDILVPRVKGLLPKKIWSARYDQINEFERTLTENGVTILKFMLHISRDEQKQRLNERLSDPEKNWKFRAGDLDDRALWDKFTKAYRGIIANTSTKHAPWFIVPANDKDVRNLLIAREIARALRAMRLRYPPADPDIKGLKVV